MTSVQGVSEQILGPFVQQHILTPTSEARLNRSTLPSTSSKKRKEGPELDVPGLGKPFQIRPYRCSAFDQPQILTPVLLLPRICLLLEYVELPDASTGRPTSRFFSGSVEALESHSESGIPRSPDAVLLSKLSGDQAFYVVERVAYRTYALCKLRPLVDVAKLGAAAAVSAARSKESTVGARYGGSQPGGQWWKAASTDGNNAQLERAAKRRKTEKTDDIKSAMKRPAYMSHDKKINPCFDPIGTTTIDGSSVEKIQAELVVSQGSLPSTHAAVTDSAKLDPQQALDTIRTQYLEALYISKTSLAYFAKGPLSRARAAANSETGNVAAMEKLITFLQESVLPLSLSDRKYRETLSGIVQGLPGSNNSDDDADAAKCIPVSLKKRKSKRVKPGKNGLFASEEHYIDRWWSMKDSELDASTSPLATMEDITTRKIAKLRTRETKLQLILALEIQALQTTAARQAVDADHGEEIAAPREAASASRRTTKTQKVPDLKLMLELLLDRLCIWQSVTNEDEHESSSARPAFKQGPWPIGKGSDLTKVVSSEEERAGESQSGSLRDFCVEVIVPFYSTRLPETCAAISRRLGGPSIASPKRAHRDGRSKRGHPSQSRNKRKIQSAVAVQGPRPLERTVTNENTSGASIRRNTAPVGLARSMTEPVRPVMKREASEISLCAIPTSVTNRSESLQEKRFRQREVDLGATVGKGDAKMRLQTRVSIELQNAIALLKKPNRGLAAKEIVETSERRRLGLVGTGKDAGSSRDVQVIATPKGNRKKDMDRMAASGGANQHQLSPQREDMQEVVPPSSAPRIPASTTRPSRRPDEISGHSEPLSPTLSRRGLFGVSSTPRLGLAKSATLGKSSLRGERAVTTTETMLTTPIRRASGKGLFGINRSIQSIGANICGGVEAAHDSIQETPSKSCKLQSSSRANPLGEVSAWGKSATMAARLQDIAPKGNLASSSLVLPGDNDEASVYASLGWDDEEDELA